MKMYAIAAAAVALMAFANAGYYYGSNYGNYNWNTGGSYGYYDGYSGSYNGGMGMYGNSYGGMGNYGSSYGGCSYGCGSSNYYYVQPYHQQYYAPTWNGGYNYWYYR